MCLSACPRGSLWGAVCLPRVASRFVRGPFCQAGQRLRRRSDHQVPAAYPHLPLALPSDSPRAALTVSHLTRRPRGPPLGPRLLLGRGILMGGPSPAPPAQSPVRTPGTCRPQTLRIPQMLPPCSFPGSRA